MEMTGLDENSGKFNAELEALEQSIFSMETALGGNFSIEQERREREKESEFVFVINKLKYRSR